MLTNNKKNKKQGDATDTPLKQVSNQNRLIFTSKNAQIAKD